MEAIRNEAQEIFNEDVRALSLDSLKVDFKWIRFGRCNLTIIGETISPTGCIAETIPQWSKEQFEVFFGDTAAARLVFGPNGPKHKANSARLGILKKELSKAAPDAKMKSAASSDYKSQTSHGKSSAGDGKSSGGSLKKSNLKPGAGRLKKPYSEKKGKIILEVTDEESELDASSSKLKDSINQSSENTGEAKKRQKTSSGKGLPQRSNNIKGTGKKPTKNTSSSANTAPMTSQQEGGSINVGYLGTIKNCAPKSSRLFRYISLKEGQPFDPEAADRALQLAAAAAKQIAEKASSSMQCS